MMIFYKIQIYIYPVFPISSLYFVMNSKIHGDIFLLYNEIGIEPSQTEALFCSNFYSKNLIEETSIVELTVNNVVKPDTKIYFAGKVNGIDCTHYCYSASVSVPLNKSLPLLPLNKQIRH